MMGRVAERERRMIFGEVAESYHHARPDYPAELIADVVAWAGGPGAAALEVGAGTGKATIPLSRSGPCRRGTRAESGHGGRVATGNG